MLKMRQLLVILLFLMLTSAEKCRYKAICVDHTMCKYKGIAAECGTVISSGVTTSYDKENVLLLHNNLRRKVAVGEEANGRPGPQPPAANMNELKWDDELSIISQRWAEQCDFGHDSCRRVDRFPVGQNAFETLSFPKAEKDGQNWEEAVQTWYSGVKKFDSKVISSFRYKLGTGHYTQLVWANTSLVGCGYITFKTKDNWFHKYYVCNYGPAGNVLGNRMYEVGKPCSICPFFCNEGLCSSS